MAELSTTVRADQRSPIFAKFGETVTYRQVSQSPNLKTGSLGASNTNTSIDEVLVGEVTKRDIRNSAGLLKVGDMAFRMLVSSLPSGEPAITSKIVFGGAVYDIITWAKSADRVAIDLFGRKP